jgi:hypothetical protein
MATITITTTGAHDLRIAKAFGRELGLQAGDNASPAQIKGYLIDVIKRVVRQQEHDEAMQAIVDNADVGAS